MILRKETLHNFSFPVSMCIYINTEYWPENYFKMGNHPNTPSQKT